jgi:nitroreductase
MNTTIDLLASRRSVPPHLLNEPGPTEAELATLLTIASRVPDHGKLAPWRFLVIQGDARSRIGERIAAAFVADEPGAPAEKVALERGRLARAPLVVGVVSRARPHVKIPEWEQVMSAGAVCMNLVVAAHAIGFAASWLTEWFAFDRRVLDAFGLAPDETVAGFIHLGRAREVPEDRVRPSLPDIVVRF